MRDPMSWALTVFRAFGIPVRVHLLFIVVSLGLFLRQIGGKDNPLWWPDVLLFTALVPFLVILLHEFGHCFGARHVDGDAKEILIWPLGGLASVEVPHTPRANFIATVAGPLMNVVICGVCVFGLALGGFLPNLNPLSNPYVSEMYSFTRERTYTSEYGLKLYEPGTNRPIAKQEDIDKRMRGEGTRENRVFEPKNAEQEAISYGGERALAPAWAVWLNRTFWLSWVLLLFNLVPAYPLDGGRMFQCAVWARTDYRRGVTVAANTGYVVAVIFLIVSIAVNEALFMGLALFMLYEASMALHRLEADDGPFGYDFSAGYTSLEKDDEPPPRPKKVGWFTRWRQARRSKKLQREIEERVQEEQRMDQLLAKIAATGKASLTDDEKRFLERVSARKRNMS
ncbi:site-2 protease family protein [Gemmata sp.]|uniref:site-2 protease family protein n=1 Tax=Gemmata sp. TaxID=1914242 RepID=UPI003F6EA465